jgi:hypothetical protein
VAEAQGAHIHITPARSGRPSSRARTFAPNELVRVEIRMPATVAKRLFDRASRIGRPVSATASDLLSSVLTEEDGGSPMA